MARPARATRQLPDPAIEPTVTITRAGRILGISRSSAYLCATKGEIPTIPLGSRRVVPTALLLQMLGLRQAS